MLSAFIMIELVAVSQNSKSSKNDRVEQLLKRMTIEEKIGQLNQLSIGFDVTGPVVNEKPIDN